MSIKEKDNRNNETEEPDYDDEEEEHRCITDAPQATTCVFIS
jgi:hypothetical protein